MCEESLSVETEAKILSSIVTSLPVLFIDGGCTKMFLQTGFSRFLSLSLSVFHVSTHALVYILQLFCSTNPMALIYNPCTRLSDPFPYIQVY